MTDRYCICTFSGQVEFTNFNFAFSCLKSKNYRSEQKPHAWICNAKRLTGVRFEVKCGGRMNELQRFHGTLFAFEIMMSSCEIAMNSCEIVISRCEIVIGKCEFVLSNDKHVVTKMKSFTGFHWQIYL